MRRNASSSESLTAPSASAFTKTPNCQPFSCFSSVSSLHRSMLHLVQINDLEDGFHVVARGFEETWNLAHDFRLSLHETRAMRWFAGKDKS